MRFASLGSGSRGNCLVIEEGATRLLLDCGFGQRETVARLAGLGLAPADISGILVTHEHGDHIDGVFPFARRWGVPVWLTRGTLLAAGDAAAGDADVNVIDGETPFGVGAIEVAPFPVPHDAREPVQYVLRGRAGRLGVLTDLGEITPHVRVMLSGLEALVLEFNHDAELLAASSYPPALRRRIGGRFGHLANAAAAALLPTIDCGRLQHLVAAHLSQENNRPEIVEAALLAALGESAAQLGVATQHRGFTWREIA